MRNHAQSESISKNNTNTRNTLYLENSINSSNVLTSNQFYKKKEYREENSSNEKTKTKTKTKNTNDINSRENKIVGDNVIHLGDEILVIHNQILDDKEIKPKIKKVNSEVELFQDYIIEDYKNQNTNDTRNVIEKLGACVEKKYSTNRYFKINNERSKRIKGSISNRVNEVNSIYEYNKNSTIFLSKRPKHSYSTSHILDTKNKDSFPLLINSPLNIEKKFSSLSEKERNDKNVASLIRLKHFLTMYWKQRKDIVVEFFQKNNIYGNFFYKDKHLYNFANFVNDNVFDDKNGTKCYIETRYPMIEIVLKGIKYKPTFDLRKVEMNKAKTIQALKNNSRMTGSVDILNREKEMADYIESKDKVEKFRNYLDRNYKKYVINKMLKRFTKEEKLVYFSGKKYGEIDIIDQRNLANNIQKQALYQKIYDSLNQEKFAKKSIKLFNNDDLAKLNEELKVVNDSVFSNIMKEKQGKKLIEQEKALGMKSQRFNNKIINKLNQRLYYTTKEKYHQNHPDIIPKKKQKLLEYVIAKRIKERKDYEDKFKIKQNNN